MKTTLPETDYRRINSRLVEIRQTLDLMMRRPDTAKGPEYWRDRDALLAERNSLSDTLRASAVAAVASPRPSAIPPFRPLFPSHTNTPCVRSAHSVCRTLLSETKARIEALREALAAAVALHDDILNQHTAMELSDSHEVTVVGIASQMDKRTADTVFAALRFANPGKVYTVTYGNGAHSVPCTISEVIPNP